MNKSLWNELKPSRAGNVLRDDRYKIAVWLLLFCLVTFSAFTQGCRVGLVLVGLVLIARLIPTITRLKSPSGKYVLVSYRWSFGEILCLLGGVAVGSTPQLGSHPWLATLGVALLAFLIIIPLCMIACIIWSFQLVTIQEDGKLKSWHGKFCVEHTAYADYLWLPGAESLLVAQSDEHYWYLYVLDVSTGVGSDRYPYNRVIGHYPRLRRLTYSNDWSWLEPMWRKYCVTPEDAISVDEQAGNYENQCRRFFKRYAPLYLSYPNAQEIRCIPAKYARESINDGLLRVSQCVGHQPLAL